MVAVPQAGFVLAPSARVASAHFSEAAGNSQNVLRRFKLCGLGQGPQARIDIAVSEEQITIRD
jgi:hypothetical protein